MIHTSAPGKIIFFGDHAVVYGRPCLSIALAQRLHVYLKPRSDHRIFLEAPDLNPPVPRTEYPFKNRELSKRLDFFERSLRKFESRVSETDRKKGFEITTSSELAPGLGSSSATIVATIAALALHYNLQLGAEELFKMGCELTTEVNAAPSSGCDVATAVYGGFMRYVKDNVPRKLEWIDYPLIAVHTGKKANTAELVTRVHEKRVKYPSIIDGIFDCIGEIVEKAEKVLASARNPEGYQVIGDLMNMQHGLLNSLGVSTDEIEHLIQLSREVSYGSKISGAGGGDYLIALVNPNRLGEFRQKLHGHSIFEIQLSEEGVFSESGQFESHTARRRTPLVPSARVR